VKEKTKHCRPALGATDVVLRVVDRVLWKASNDCSLKKTCGGRVVSRHMFKMHNTRLRKESHVAVSLPLGMAQYQKEGVRQGILESCASPKDRRIWMDGVKRN
jgi:hypothetical protein